MDNSGFWMVAGAMTLGVSLLLLLSLWRGRGQALPAAAQDIQVYRDQLAEVDRDLARGTLPEAEAQRTRTEIARRLLAADKALSETAPGTASGRAPVVVAVVLVLAAAGGALALYDRTGVPWYPDLPLDRRLAELDAAIAARPSQAAFLAEQGRPIDTAAESKQAAEFAAQSDPAALKTAYETQYAARDYRGAVLAMQRLIQVLGDKADSFDHLGLAVALVAEADGYISPEAEQALRAALKLDMRNEAALFLVGDLFRQGGRFDRAFEFWQPVVEYGNPDAPWVAAARDQIETLAQLAGIPYSLPGAEGGRGPSQADMAAAAEMTPDEQQAMIEGMVAQLSDRLAKEGGSASEWAQLIRALGVLGRTEQAKAIYDESKGRFADRPGDLAALAEAAGAAGLTP